MGGWFDLVGITVCIRCRRSRRRTVLALIACQATRAATFADAHGVHHRINALAFVALTGRAVDDQG
jgi:hypothetical protein